MYSSAKLCKTGIIIIFAMIIFGLSQLAFSQGSYLLEIDVDDVIACPGQTTVSIPIYMKNYADTVAAFSLWLQLDRPDIMKFQAGLDIIEYEVHYIYTEWDSSVPPIPIDSVVASPTWVCIDGDFPICVDSAQLLGYYQCTEFSGPECIDSVFVEWQEGIDPVYIELKEVMVGNIDTVGTLISGWDVSARSLIGNGQDILISASVKSHWFPPGTGDPGIGFPQEGEIPLIKLLADVLPIDDTATNRTVTIHIEYNILDYFAFSNELGESQCIITEEVEEYEYFMCDQWLIPDEICMYWNRVMESECPPEGCDSIAVDTILHGYLDDAPRCCDPVTGECITGIEESECPSQFGGTGVWFDGCISITDGSLYVKRCLCGDLNDDGMFNILDIIFLLNHIYKKGPAPEPIILADTDGDGRISILDIVCLISAKYKFGNCCDDPSWLR